jgi:tetratricopeptide (TPR) repeat protein
MIAIGRIFFILILIFGSRIRTAGQTLEIDSLTLKLNVVGGEEKLKILRRLLSIYQYSDISQSIAYVDEAIDLVNRKHDSVGLARLIRMKAQFLCKRGHFHVVKPMLAPWLTYCKDKPRELVHMLTLVGITEVMQGNYANALAYFERALSVPPTTGGVLIESLFNNIGLVYYKLRDNHKASYFFSKAISNIVFNPDTFEDSFHYSNLGLVYGEMGYFETAESLIKTSFTLCGKEDANAIIAAKYALGQVKLRQGKLIDSENILTQTLAMAESESDSRFVAECLVLLATIRLERDDVQAALSMLKKCERIAVQYQYKEILFACYKAMVSLFENTNDLALLSKYQAAVMQLSSTLNSRAVLEKVYVFEMELRKKHNSEILRSQDAQMRIQNEIAASQRIEYYAILIIGMLLVISTALIYNLYKGNHLVYKDLRLRVSEREAKLEEISRIRQEDFVEKMDKLKQVTAPLVGFEFDEGHSLSDKINSTIQQLGMLTHRLLKLSSLQQDLSESGKEDFDAFRL